MAKERKVILVAYDGFERDEPISQIATALAEEHKASVRLLNVAPAIGRRLFQQGKLSEEEVTEAVRQHRVERLEGIAKPLRDKGIEVETVVRVGRAHEEIIREAVTCDADLVIVSDELKHRGEQRGFGSVTIKLLRECPCPVLAKRDPSKAKHENVLAAVDLAHPDDQVRALNKTIVERAALFAKRCGGKLTVMHAWSVWSEEAEQLIRTRAKLTDEEFEEILEETKDARAKELTRLVAEADCMGVNVVPVLRRGDATELLPIVVEEEGFDLVVMGTVSRGGLDGLLLGNTAEKMVRKLRCAVLTVKPEGFVSPVSQK